MDIAAAKKRCEAATPEPWEVWEYEEHFEPYNRAVSVVMEWQEVEGKPKGYSKIDSTVLTQADAEFIAHARSDLPAALEALEEAVKSYEAMRHSWSEEHNALLEAKGKLERIETEACTCGGGIERPFGCIVHDDASVIARILRGCKEDSE